MMQRQHRIIITILACVPVASGAVAQDDFDHAQHEGLFPRCETCHAMAPSTGNPGMPTVASCDVCHDGAVEDRVRYTLPVTSPPSNLRFGHERHEAAIADIGPDSSIACAACHGAEEEQPMLVHRAVAEQCVSCHDIERAHLQASSGECATCHVPLWDATTLSRETIGAFPAPQSHEAPDYAGERHGSETLDAAIDGLPASCATCHAREFCLQCHVDGPEQPSIASLQPDPRSTALVASLRAPDTHVPTDFASLHGQQPQSECATCHTQDSCVACHVATGSVASDLARGGPGRAVGAVVNRHPPASHDLAFRFDHRNAATASPPTCAGCHARDDCLTCHRPDSRSVPSGYHPPDFMTRHPAAAYARETTCTDCHSNGGFCSSCHARSGVVQERTGLLGAGFHDAKQFFLFGHGVPARQALESCVSCHTERDCISCHAAVGGRRFNPHGPGFDPTRLRRRNPEMCQVCHGTDIPGG